jgi:ATP-dependent Clp endopeptidase proteolytic subunit ClpP
MKRRYASRRARSTRMSDGSIHEHGSVQSNDHEHEVMAMGNDRGMEVEENRIYFYCPVGEQEALELNHVLRRLDVEMQYLSMRLGCGVVPIHLHIHSPGGSLFSGLSIVDTMLRCKTPIHTYVEGSAASAATFIACCGTKGYRHIGKHSFMLVHQPQIEWAGKLDEFRDEIKNQKELFEKILQIYLDRTNFGREELEELLQHELWLNADTCIEKGLADGIF